MKNSIESKIKYLLENEYNYKKYFGYQINNIYYFIMGKVDYNYNLVTKNLLCYCIESYIDNEIIEEFQQVEEDNIIDDLPF